MRRITTVPRCPGCTCSCVAFRQVFGNPRRVFSGDQRGRVRDRFIQFAILPTELAVRILRDFGSIHMLHFFDYVVDYLTFKDTELIAQFNVIIFGTNRFSW